MSSRPQANPKPEWTAKVTEWSAEKGYGWLQWADKRVFLHRRDFSGPHRTPAVGEEVRFILGMDTQGRPCAKNAVSTRGGGFGSGLMRLLMLCVLLALPAIAARRLPFELWQIVAYALTLSWLTYATYASDKRRARTKAWRIPESHLHLLELLGGWPGAWLAQRHLRHKCSKSSYQFIFWAIILMHQFAAYDSLQDWRLTRVLLQHVTELPASAGSRSSTLR
jgi:uncharacterized membrane protein YsdA (DUF1294 family)/cold shock CspA family protein